MFNLRKHEDINRKTWFFEIGKWEFIIDIKKWKFKNPFKDRKVFHLKL